MRSNAGSGAAMGSCVTQKNQLCSLGLGFPRSEDMELEEVLPAPAGGLWQPSLCSFSSSGHGRCLALYFLVTVWPMCVFLRRQLRVYCEA